MIHRTQMMGAANAITPKPAGPREQSPGGECPGGTYLWCTYTPAGALIGCICTPLGEGSGGGEEDGTILWEIVEAENEAPLPGLNRNTTSHANADGGEEDGTILWEIVEAAEGSFLPAKPGCGGQCGGTHSRKIRASNQVHPREVAWRPGTDSNLVAQKLLQRARPIDRR